jgi:hypothetical protein
MKLTEFKKLIQEEVRKVVKEDYRDADAKIDINKLKKILNQASKVTSDSGKKLLNGNINEFLKFIQLAITSLKNQDADWGDKVTGTPLLYILLSSRYKGKDRDKWEAFNQVMQQFSEASYNSDHGTNPKEIIDELQEALIGLQQFINSNQ